MKIFGAIIITIVTVTMFLSLFHMSMGMDMAGGMTDCPFMSHEETICPMNIMDHIGSWKDVFLSVSPPLVLLIALAGASLLIVSTAPNLLQGIRYLLPLIYKTRLRQSYTFSYRALQELFSSGILHPKLFKCLS
jgi:hypothetical protein